MVIIGKFKELCHSFPGVTEYQHFDRRAFKSKRIFVTLHEEHFEANFMFSPEEQADFCSLNPSAITQLPNKWGLNGVTNMRLEMLEEDVIMAALEVAYVRNRRK